MTRFVAAKKINKIIKSNTVYRHHHYKLYLKTIAHKQYSTTKYYDIFVY